MLHRAPSVGAMDQHKTLSQPCLLWKGYTDRDGYGVRWIAGRGTVRVHRWVYASAFGAEAIAGLVVRHTCDTPGCFRLDHLRVGTPLDNVRDAQRRGRLPVRPEPTPELIARTDHGTRTAYVAGCNCEPCRTAERTYRRHLRAEARANR